jgi:predicted metal-dependent HD superfamily phosphohydrolase
MQQRFISLWERCVPVPRARSAEDVYRDLEGHYSHPNRHYHDLRHIGACLKHFDAINGQLTRPDAVEMALWFHDAVYQPDADDNERRSAELFLGLAEGGADSSFLEVVRDLVMMTAHPSKPTSVDEQFTVDIDLASFGLPWEVFIRLGELVRNEFPHLSDRDFESVQLQFFEELAGQPYFFFTDFFRSRYEAAAQSNLRRRITQLRRGNV